MNLGEYFNTRFFLTYSLPFTIIKSNLNLTSGFVFNQIPAVINEKINISRNYNLSEGVSLSSNISENFDFNLSYLGSYSIAINSLQASIHQNYFNHSLSLNLNKIFFERWIFNTSVNQSYFTGLSTNFNTSFTLINLALAYKFFKAKNIEARISVFDALNQNNSISRNFTETYTEDVKSNVLGRYYMFTLSYFLKDFKKQGSN